MAGYQLNTGWVTLQEANRFVRGLQEADRKPWFAVKAAERRAYLRKAYITLAFNGDYAFPSIPEEPMKLAQLTLAVGYPVENSGETPDGPGHIAAGIKSLRIGSFSVSFASKAEMREPGQSSGSVPLPDDVSALVSRYKVKRPLIGRFFRGR